MCGQGVRDGILVHLYLVRIVDDDIDLSESSIVDHERCCLLRAVVDVTMSVHVGDGLSVTRVPNQLNGDCDDGHERVDVSFASRCTEKSRLEIYGRFSRVLMRGALYGSL